MSKIDLSLDIDKIRRRLEDDQKGFKPSEWAKRVGVSKNVVTNIHGATRQRPSLEYIVAVSRFTGKPVEWYLYGTQAEQDKQKEMLKGETSQKVSDEKYSEADQEFPIHPLAVEDKAPNESFKVSEDLTMAAAILESTTPYSTALHLNIQSFHRAIQAEDRIVQIESHQKNMDDDFSKILSELKEIKEEISVLRSENKLLKENLEKLGGSPAGTSGKDTGGDSESKLKKAM